MINAMILILALLIGEMPGNVNYKIFAIRNFNFL